MFRKQHSIQFKYLSFYYDNCYDPNLKYLCEKPTVIREYISEKEENYMTALYFILRDLELREQTKEVKEKLQIIYEICDQTIENYLVKKYTHDICIPNINFNNISDEVFSLILEKGKKAQAKISEKDAMFLKTYEANLDENKYYKLFDSINDDLENFRNKNELHEPSLLTKQLAEFKKYYSKKELYEVKFPTFNFIEALQSIAKFYGVKLGQDKSKKAKKHFNELLNFIDEYTLMRKVYVNNYGYYNRVTNGISLPDKDYRITHCFVPGGKLYDTIINTGKKAEECLLSKDRKTMKVLSEL